MIATTLFASIDANQFISIVISKLPLLIIPMSMLFLIFLFEPKLVDKDNKIDYKKQTPKAVLETLIIILLIIFMWYLSATNTLHLWY